MSRGVSGPGKPASRFWQRPGKAERGFSRGVRGAAGVKNVETHQGRRPVYGGAPRNRRRKGYGDARCAPARLRWAGAAPAENSKQGNLAGGPGVLRTPGRRPPHRNGGTFGSFGHERTTMIREVVKKMAAIPTRQLTYKANPARANKEKMQRPRRGGVRGYPQRTVPGRPVRPILAVRAAGRGAGLSVKRLPSEGPLGR